MRNKIGNGVKTASKIIGFVGVLACIAIAIMNFVISLDSQYIVTGLVWLIVGSTLSICFANIIYGFGHLINCVENMSICSAQNKTQDTTIDISEPPIKKSNIKNNPVFGYVALIFALMGFTMPEYSLLGLLMGILILLLCWEQITDDKSKLFSFKTNASLGFYAIAFSFFVGVLRVIVPLLRY